MRTENQFLFVICICVLTFIGFTTASDRVHCNNTAGNFTENGSSYGQNRDSILSSLTSNVPENDGFYNTTIGQDPDKVYALALCRADLSAEDCGSCITSLIQRVNSTCLNQKQAYAYIVSPQVCMLRYSNRSIFGILELEPVDADYNTNATVSSLPEFDQVWGNLMAGVMRRASSRIGIKFDGGEANLTSVQTTIYNIMQCTPDLSGNDCYNCLNQSVMISYQSCCYGKQGGYVHRPSCFWRWDNYPFYQSSPPSPTIVSPTPTKKRKSERIQIAGSLSAVVGLIVFGSFAFTIWRRRKNGSKGFRIRNFEWGENGDNDFTNQEFRGENGEGSQEFPSIQLDILNAATKHFCDANKLGEGGFGPVYKGILADGKEIAVKRLSKTSGQGLLEFKNEIILIAKLQHRNLVRLLGCCLESNEKLLVYEYMPNRSLDVFLFNINLSMQLDWQRRFCIINGIARGMLYLHEDSRLRIVHRDLKTSNILLDGEMNPKISDFGLARIFGGNQREARTKRVVGTYGYMAPEYAMQGLFSIKSDVFSFGVLLLEIITGKKNNGFSFYELGDSLLTSAWKLWSDDHGLELMDKVLVQTCVQSEVLRCIHIGLLCVQKDPAHRPTMSSVIQMLVSETNALPQPTEPAFFVGRQDVSPTKDNIVYSLNELTLSNVEPR